MSGTCLYFDNNATTKLLPEVLDCMTPFLGEEFGNPSTVYPLGVKARDSIELARRQVADLIHADKNEIIFTSGGSESNSTAIFSLIRSDQKRKHILTSPVEHDSIILVMDYLKKCGYEIEYVPVDSLGRIDLPKMVNLIRNDTLLISIMFANNEIGNIYDIKSISDLARSKGVFFHTDAVQAVGKIPVDLSNLDIDTLSLSGHKFHAPKGVGVLYVNKRCQFFPIIFGHQEGLKRGGTENVSSIVGLGQAAHIAESTLTQKMKTVSEIRDYFEKKIEENINEVVINGDILHRTPNTSNISFPGISGDQIVLMLALKGICISTGSACNSKDISPSHVLSAMNIPESLIRSIRVSFDSENKKSEVDMLITELTATVKNIRKRR